MEVLSFTNLLIVSAIALAAPLLLGLFSRIRVPAVVLEIVAGIAVGPSGLGWVEVDVPIQVLSLLGLAVLALTRLQRSARLEMVLVKLQDTTAEIRVRFAVLLLMAFVAMAGTLGLEAVLGAFLAGAILGMVDRDTMTHPHFHLKLEAIGYGFVIPVFFVASGLRFDLQSLLDAPSAVLRVPLFLAVLLAVRALPAVLLYGPAIGGREAAAAGLLQATSLPFVVAATSIGVTLGEITPVTGAALVSAGLLSVMIFPLVAVTLLRPAVPSTSAAR